MKKFENVYQDAALMRKVLLGEADEVEQKDLEKRLAECPDLRNVYEQLQSGETLKVAFGEYQKYSSKKAYQSFLQSIGQMESKGRKSRSRRVGWYAAAAVVTLAVALSFYMSNYISSEKEGKTLIQPGTQQAQLTLSDGSVIDVHRKEVSVVVDGVQVKYKKGVLSYQPTVTTQHEEKNIEEQSGKSNELVIPRGGENTVILADGTTVHLNAGSKLTYPVRFAATEFNVNAYADTPVCYTTLVHGKVKFSTLNAETVTLSPGEQAVVFANSSTKRKVDLEEYVGWVDGMYIFNDRPLGDIMKTFERWYDIQVYYETPNLRDITYSGNLKRYGTINSFLDALELTGDLTYKISGRNILIYDKVEEQEWKR